MGLGFLGIRDLLSMIRFETHDSAGNPNPLAGHVEKLYGTGQSMSGRVVREYVYEGWNEDAEGRKLFDGVHTHTGSGRLFQNTRFAQVGRYPRQHEEHQWPAEYYPFTFNTVPDPFSGRVDGLWKRPATDPLVIHTHTEGDYWVRHVSLAHTDPRDGSDVEMPETTRMYHLTAAPHMARPADRPDLDRPADAERHVRGALSPRRPGAARRLGDERRRAAPDACSPRAVGRHARRRRTRRWRATRTSRASTCPRARAGCRATTTAPTSTSRGIMSVFPPEPVPARSTRSACR